MSYEEELKNNFKNLELEILQEMFEDDFDDDEDEFYTNDNLNKIITLLHQKMVTYGDIKVEEKGIIKFTENKYNSLEFVFEINMGNSVDYQVVLANG